MFAYAAPGIVAAVLLGLGRAFGEAIAVTQTIGSAQRDPHLAGSSPATRSAAGSRPQYQGATSSSQACVDPLPRRDPDGHLARDERRRAVRREQVREGAEGDVSARRAADPYDVTVRSNGLRRRRIVEQVVRGARRPVARSSPSAILALVLGTVLYKGLSQLDLSFFTEPRPLFGEEGGIADALVGSALIVGMAMLMAIPVAVLVAIYMAEYAGPAISRRSAIVLDVLNGVPAIVVGIFVFGLLVVGHGQSAIYGAFALAILMLPMVARATQEVLDVVPRSLRDASLALGVTRWRTTWSIILPTAIGGILTGVVIAVARVAGETAPLLFTSSIAANAGLVRRPQRAADAAGDDLTSTRSRPIRASRRPAGRPRSC